MSGRARMTAGGLAALIAVALALRVAFPGNGDPQLWPPTGNDARVAIHVVSHGYHAGVAIDRAAMARVAGQQEYRFLMGIAQKFANYNWLEIGWGDEGFYTSVPEAASVTAGLALRALFMPRNPSVLHVAGLSADPRAAFPKSDIVRIELSEAGFARMLERIEASFAHNAGDGPEDLGPGLYGPSRFFRGVDHFNIFHVCNHWVAALIGAAGLQVSPIAATLPPGLFLDLRWRSGLEPSPKPAG